MSNRDEMDVKLVDEAIMKLIDHFDSVHIFATRDEPDGTSCIQKGGGNWFARYGQISLWLEKQKIIEIKPENEQ